MTPKKRWPNEAENARMDAIALAERVKAQCLPILEALEQNRTPTAIEIALRLGRILNSANEIKVKLIEASPQKFLD